MTVLTQDTRTGEAVDRGLLALAQAQSCAEAVELAGSLRHIRIHPDAPRDIERMDESPKSELWGQRLWKHLLALDAYAEAKGPGFQAWCESAGHPEAVSSKFIAMTESDTVKNSERLSRSRRFPVSTAIDPSGTMHMWSHLKPVQGGGKQIPRIYFHDDTKGDTGVVHIGFIGPHDLVPNTKAK